MSRSRPSVTVAVVNVNEQNSLPAELQFCGERKSRHRNCWRHGCGDRPRQRRGRSRGQQRYYFLNGTTASALGRWPISDQRDDGAITTAAALNFEAALAERHLYVVIARDNAGLPATSRRKVRSRSGSPTLNEANSLPATYSLSVNENVVVGTAVGTVAAIDLDSAAVALASSAIISQWHDGERAAGRWPISDQRDDGAITTAAALNFEAARRVPPTR